MSKETRIIHATIKLDYTVATEYDKRYGIPSVEDVGEIEYLSTEFGWLEESGLFLEEARITDDDETDPREAYRNYLLAFAMDLDTDAENISPLSYEGWKHEML